MLDDTVITVLREGEIGAWLLSLNQTWFSCQVHYHAMGALWIADTAEPIRGGMSGSPIMSEDGATIGVVSIAAHGPNPCLANHLPGWLLRAE